MTVIDASAYVEALTAATPLGEWSRSQLEGRAPFHAPEMMPAEVLSALRRVVAGGRVRHDVVRQAVLAVRDSRMHLHPLRPFVDRVWELRTTVTVYDAWYVALAERLDTELVTTDARLAGAPGPRCRIVAPA